MTLQKIAFFILSAVYLTATAAPLERPPQFVLISFDGSKSENFWNESLRLADQNKARFSYFISGVYFVPKSKSSQYKGPRHGTGKSDIGWADEDTNKIKARTEYVWSALSKKFDIGSHVNGHFDGGSWSYDEWKREFVYFHKFIEGVFNLVPKAKTSFATAWPGTIRDNMKGFRAPLLAENAATQRVLKDMGYTYNASGQTNSEWPSQMKNGVWDIGLARITLAGTKRATVAMDYNVFYGQCNGRFSKSGSECAGFNASAAKRFEEQTYQSYIQTFLKNYYGNRAPFSVGHHFSLWNKGTYWKAMQRFVQAVCTQPEVACITHKDMVGYMKNTVSQQGPDVIARLNKGDFEKIRIPVTVGQNLRKKLVLGVKMIETPIVIDDSAAEVMLKGDLLEAHLNEADEDMTSYRVSP